MEATIELLAAVVLFCLGIRLSAFFSGGETGFYRISPLRIAVDAEGQDRQARRILRFTETPSRFVATTLVGNNLANFMTTGAVGMALTVFIAEPSAFVEVVASLSVSPFVFVLGELVPKLLYFTAPVRFLRRDSSMFAVCYWILLPISFPVVGLTRLFEKLGGAKSRTDPRHIVHIFREGHQEGLLADVQSRMADGVMRAANDSVLTAVVASSRVAGISTSTSRADALAFAKQSGVSHVFVRDEAGEWVGYLRVVDLAVSGQPISDLICSMPRISAGANKLEALMQLRHDGAASGLVHRDDRLIGIIDGRELIRQLLHV